MDCNIVEVMILSFKSCESLLFSNLFQRDCMFVLLEASKMVSLGELIDHGFDLLLLMVYKYFNY